MSHPQVLADFKARVVGLMTLDSPPIAVPLLETLNIRPSSAPDKFITLERDHSYTSRITLGVPTQFREMGIISIVVHVRSGIGADAADILAEQVCDLFHNFSVGYLQVLTVGSAVFVNPDDGNFFELKVPVDYMFDFFKP